MECSSSREKLLVNFNKKAAEFCEQAQGALGLLLGVLLRSGCFFNFIPDLCHARIDECSAIDLQDSLQ